MEKIPLTCVAPHTLQSLSRPKLNANVSEHLKYILTKASNSCLYACCVVQRQRIRELILKQQQQRSAIRQEAAGNLAPGTPRPWPQEAPGQQGEMFNRPPPPYPGQGPIRGPMRFPGPFPGDQQTPFPNEGQIPRSQLSGDPNLRHQGPRFVLYYYSNTS